MSDDAELPEFDYWRFDPDYVEEDLRTLSAWSYDGEDQYEDDLRVRITAEGDRFLFVPPAQFFASGLHEYDDVETAYQEAVRYVENFDVPKIGGIK